MAEGDLTTLAAVKAWLPDLGTTTSSDAILSTLITAASDWLVQYLGRPILQADYTETYLGSGSNILTVRNSPVTAVSSIQFSGLTVSTPATGNPLSGGFFFDDAQIRLFSSVPSAPAFIDRFPYREPVTVNYTAGYATVPPSIQQACNELVGEAFARRARIGQVSKTLGGQETVSFSQKDMSDFTRTALASFVRVVPC